MLLSLFLNILCNPAARQRVQKEKKMSAFWTPKHLLVCIGLSLSPFFSFFFFGCPRHMEVPGPGIRSELQL